MSTQREQSPLIEPSPRTQCSKCCSSRVKYRLPKIKEKGAIVVIVCNVLIISAFFALIQESYLMSSTFSIILPLMALITFPFAGIVADIYVGRFKVIQASIVFLMASSVLGILIILLKGYPTVATITKSVMLGLRCVGGSCYIACSLPFIGDQLIGASGEQLSFALYWMMWGFVIAFNTVLLSYLPGGYFDFIAPAVALLCVSTMAFILCLWKDSLNNVHQQTNPYKQIFRVLHYSWRHKYPERRSALTYWEEDIPSRIDLGMSKYGGPFTVEEVEDVKTVFRLLPIILCAGGCNVGVYIGWEKLITDDVLFDKCKDMLIYLTVFHLMVVVLGIPLYHLLLYPFFYNYIPRMLKRVGSGLLLLLCSFIGYAAIGNILLCSSHTNVTCLIFNSKTFSISSNGFWWLLLPTTAYNIGFLLSAITLAEFVFAQTPHSIQGLMTGLMVLSAGISSCIGFGVCKLANAIFPNTDSWFSSNIALAVASAVYLILFVCFSKCYKLRKRDDIVPIHLFAEEYFEKELEGQKRLDKERFKWK